LTSLINLLPEGMRGYVRAALVIVLLYLFLVGVGSLESGIRFMGAGFQEGLIRSVANPLAGLFAGILATVLVQSSSVSTATIVGLVGAGTLDVSLAVPMIMGANIGTTVTNTLASLGHVRRGEEFRRAFAAATVHDFFNILAVAILFPLELLTGVFSHLATQISEPLAAAGLVGIEARSPIRQAVKAGVGVIEAPLEAFLRPDPAIGVVMLLIGLGLIFLALGNITRNMRELIAGRIERSMNRIIGRGGGSIGIVVGVVITIMVQSSSITTSILIPMVAAGVLSLNNAYPITLGANVGTTITALLAALAVDLAAGLVIALVHTLFNLAGILIFYPLPFLREIPIRLAERMGDIAMGHRTAVAFYVGGLFFVLPLAVVAILR
jgi:solute carrier family 34 (sodium-dependent phosphate cotransporter)